MGVKTKFDKKLDIFAKELRKKSTDAEIKLGWKLRAQNFKVLRFWNNDIFDNFDGVLTCILETLSH